MFIKITYYRVSPMTKQLNAGFGYWTGDTTVSVIATWDSSPTLTLFLFSESKFKTRDNSVVSFTRKYIQIDNRFFDYCMVTV